MDRLLLLFQNLLVRKSVQRIVVWIQWQIFSIRELLSGEYATFYIRCPENRCLENSLVKIFIYLSGELLFGEFSGENIKFHLENFLLCVYFK